MGFNNPVVGGDKLIRSSIQSPNYQQGLVGWAINQDGSADFTGTVGLTNVSASDSFLYRGEELQTILDRNGRGLQFYGFLPAGAYSTSVAGTKFYLWSMDLMMDPDRNLAFGIDEIAVTGSAAGVDAYAGVDYTTDGTDPKSSGTATQLGACRVSTYTAGKGASNQGTWELITPHNSGNQTRYRIVWYLVSFGGTCTTENARPTKFTVHDTGGVPAQSVGKNEVTSVSKTQKTPFFLATDSRSYQGSGNASNGSGGAPNTYMYYGQDPGYAPNGNWRSYCWFNASDLNQFIGVPTGSYSYCQLWIYTAWWYQIAGGTLLVGWHGNGSVTGTENLGGGAYNVGQVPYSGRGVGQWIDILHNGTIMAALNAGTFKGIVLGPGNAGIASYGYAAGAGFGSNVPAIRAQYVS